MSVEYIDDSGERFNTGCITQILRDWNGKEISFESQKTKLSSLCNSLFSDDIHPHHDPLVRGRGVQPVGDSSSRASMVAMTCLGASLEGKITADSNTDGNSKVEVELFVKETTENGYSWSAELDGTLQRDANGDVRGNVHGELKFEMEF